MNVYSEEDEDIVNMTFNMKSRGSKESSQDFEIED